MGRYTSYKISEKTGCLNAYKSFKKIGSFHDIPIIPSSFCGKICSGKTLTTNSRKIKFMSVVTDGINTVHYITDEGVL